MRKESYKGNGEDSEERGASDILDLEPRASKIEMTMKLHERCSSLSGGYIGSPSHS